MADPGANLANLGDNIAKMMLHYHKQHQDYDKSYNMADALSRIGYKDGRLVPTVDAEGKKVADVQPILDKKVVEMFKTDVSGKRSEAKGALDLITRFGIAQVQHQMTQKPTRESTIGGEKFQLSEAGAATMAMQKEAQRRADEAAGEKAKRNKAADVRAETQLDISKQGLDIRKEGLNIRKQGTEAKWTAAQPETKFFNETGLTPQVLLSPESLEAGYTGVEKATGKPIGDIDPLKPGQTLKSFTTPPTGYEKFWNNLTQVMPSGEPPPPHKLDVTFVPKPGGAYRESEFKFPSQKDPKTGQKLPPVTVNAPHPDGTFLRIGDNRIPYQQAAQIRATAVKRKADAIDSLKTLPLPMIKKRLSDLGYDPDDAFFGLPK